MKKKIAIFGGSFNPPHIGHKKIIEIVRDFFECDEIWLMPSGNRADKTMHTTDEHRLNMARIFATDLKLNDLESDSTLDTKDAKPNIIVSPIEIQRPVPTTTIDTLRELELAHPDSEFYFIISSELVPDIRAFWDDGQELFERAKFIILERLGSHSITNLELPPHSTLINHDGIVIPEISSTTLRGLRDVRELTQWVGKELAEYIAEHKLYGFSETQ
jgi:nicotinate-nucleotide adenylyltransferase